MEIAVPYRYRQLQQGEIRVIDILPSFLQKDVLRCRIRHASLLSDPAFEALSYAWGDPHETQEIICSDADVDQNKSGKYGPGASLMVTKTLSEALRGRRGRFSKISMWADQICIDQSNIPERNEQVKLMSTIYTQAKSVRIWLGPPQAVDKFTEKCLTELLIKGFVQRGSDPRVHMFFPKLKDAGWDALEKFFNRPWFFRTWILQEAILASKSVVVFGDYTWPWKAILAAISTVSMFWQELRFTKTPAALSCFRAILSIRCYRNGDLSPTPKLLDIISFGRRQEAADDRDKVFAFLGLSQNEQDQKHLVPDYSLNTDDVYTELAIHCLSQHDDPQFLSHVCPSTRGLPTWVPDWTLKPDATSRILAWHFRAATSQKPKWTLSPCRKRLTLSGYLVGGVRKLSPVQKSTNGSVLSAEQLFNYGQTFLNAAQELAQETPDRYPNGQSRAEAFAHAMICDTTTLGKRATSEDLKPFEYLVKMYKYDFQYATTSIPNATLRVVAQFESDFMRNSPGRLFCLLDDGEHFGWVPSESDPHRGDFVVLFAGSTEFTVLRPVVTPEQEGSTEQKKPRYYQVIGMAYVHGLMHGEYLRRPNLRTQDYCLV